MPKLCRRLYILVAIAALVLVSCSGPGDADAEAAIRKSMKRFVPVSLSKDLGGGRNARIDELKIIEIGSSQGEGSHEFWPVKVFARGRCSVTFGGMKNFQGETVYNLSKDGFGEWVAEHAGMFP